MIWSRYSRFAVQELHGADATTAEFATRPLAAGDDRLELRKDTPYARQLKESAVVNSPAPTTPVTARSSSASLPSHYPDGTPILHMAALSDWPSPSPAAADGSRDMAPEYEWQNGTLGRKHPSSGRSRF